MKRGSYVFFSPENKTKVAKYAAENGVTASLHHFRQTGEFDNYTILSRRYFHVICECLQLSCGQINAKMQFLSFSQIFNASKISAYAVVPTSRERLMLFTILLLTVRFSLHIILIKDLIISLSGPFHNTARHSHVFHTHVFQ